MGNNEATWKTKYKMQQKGTNFSFISALYCRPLAEMNDTKATNSTVDGEVNYKEDLFCWTIEGVGILVIGLIGVFGNSCSMVLFSRQKVHRIFHHLLLLLSFFDLVSVRDRPRFFDQVGHQTTNASIGNKHFFTMLNQKMRKMSHL